MTLAVPVFDHQQSPLELGSHVAVSTEQNLGQIVLRHDIKSSLGPFKTLPKYRVRYPGSVIRALIELYHEYNSAFGQLVAQSGDSYPRCRLDRGRGRSVIRWVQIDMVGLPQSFLHEARSAHVDEVREALRHWIFEIESSVAMYQLLGDLFPASPFKARFQNTLDSLRQYHRMPVALLAVTEQKYAAMCQEEFGKRPGEAPTPEEVRKLTGFDWFFGPEGFKEHRRSGGREYLLFVRASDPVDVLKHPGRPFDRGLLENPEMRAHIRAYAVTPCVDDPAVREGLNDTKSYLPLMDMGFRVDAAVDLFSADVLEGRWHRGADVPVLSKAFAAYLRRAGVSEELIQTGRVPCRLKPGQGTYGCYGHIRLEPRNIAADMGRPDRRDNPRLVKQIGLRGFYVAQPERRTPTILNLDDGMTLGHVDRVFIGTSWDRDGRAEFLGGFRSMGDVEGQEMTEGRGHGGDETIWAPITD